MSTLDATVSMLEAMPEDARIKVMEFTQNCSHPENPQIHSSRSVRNRSFPTLPNHASRFLMARGLTWKTL